MLIHHFSKYQWLILTPTLTLTLNLNFFVADVVISVEQGANDLRMVELMPLPSHHLLLH